MTNHAELRALAEKALNVRSAIGEWKSYWRKTDGEPDCGVFTETSPGHAYSICRCPRYETKEDWERVGGYIAAANPAAVLELLDSHAELLACLEFAVKVAPLMMKDLAQVENWRATIAKRKESDMRITCIAPETQEFLTADQVYADVESAAPDAQGWVPKVGEMVEVSDYVNDDGSLKLSVERKFSVMCGNKFGCFSGGQVTYSWKYCRPISPAEPKAGGEWIEWKGGECPVPIGTKVEVRFRNLPDLVRAGKTVGIVGVTDYCSPIFFDHSHQSNTDIIAYKVVAP